VLRIACLGAVTCGGWQWTGRLFVRGVNLCKLVSTSKLEVATGLKLPAPAWGGAYCRWVLSPGRLKDSVWLSVHRGVGRKGVDAMTRDERRVMVTTVTVPGASYAVLVTAGYRGIVRDWVIAVYPEGAVVVNVTAPRLTPARAIAAATPVVS
jgi:hypothetical protein